MSKAILGTKLGMSQVFAENGDLVPVTVVEVLPNVVAGVKTVETDGYNAVQIAILTALRSILTRPCTAARCTSPLRHTPARPSAIC